ncbi:hypothetical protein [Deminuibacter soli]|uniref:DUF2116 family Zn-ribbon domain-containing protein n=1 Tax=Deminuibacter soli TaxID=2291815 RepID=A0A3E1NQR2_9BACT|nr:hypothetical protein [Deminuibacter soli]RFM30263.1 hypothetical protein DXN05_04645 [Deminuibacter soli]
MNTANQMCLECGKPLKGRRDKKYCDDQCRNNYNNKQQHGTDEPVRRINHILKRNRQILKEALGNDRTIVLAHEALLEKGYDFTYHTDQFVTQTNQVYHYCYDYGLKKNDNNRYMIVKKMEKKN